MGLALWGQRPTHEHQGVSELPSGVSEVQWKYPLLLVNTWSHEEESHARCHKREAGHSHIAGRRPPALAVHRSALSPAREAADALRLRASGCGFPVWFRVP